MTRHTPKMFLLAALCALALSGCYQTYSAESITATVVDADTKQPLEGVVVAAHWEMKGGLEGGNVEGEVMIMEAVTDSTGTFHFPAWGPKRIYVGLSNARLTGDTPEMILFKSGYEIQLATNHATKENMYGVGSHVSSDWNGNTIEMKKFVGTLEKYAYYVAGFFPGYAFAGHCGWQKIPMMLTALRDQSIVFKRAGMNAGNFYWDLVTNNGYGCGSVDDFLQGRAK